MTYLIVGNGPAGVSAIERIREYDLDGRIILVSPENNLPYSRIMTPEYMTDEVKEDDLYIRGTDFYEQHNVETLLGYKVEKVIPEENKAILDNGQEINYDQLLIASGSRPLVPAWVDTKLQGVFTLWDKVDSERINTYLPNTEKAVIIGGGLVGLQAARALTAAGVKVTIIEKLERLMPLQLDEAASSMLLEAIETNGVRVLLGTEVTAIEGREGKVIKVKTSGEEIPADLVLVSIGVRPNLEMIEGTSLMKDKGLVADLSMQTNISNIYAAGDIAQVPCKLSGNSTLRALWLCAIQQGKVAGANMAGAKETYQGSNAMNSIQLFGLSFISLGQINGGDGVEEIIVSPPKSGNYQKLLVKDGRLEGIVFVGDVQKAGVLYHKLGKNLAEGFWSSFENLDPEKMVG